MNVRTLRKTLDNYGFETVSVLDCLLDVFIKQNISERGVLAGDVLSVTGVLQSYRLLEKVSWGKVNLFRCTPRGEGVARELLTEKIPPAFDEMSRLDIQGSYLILKYLLYLVNHGKNVPLLRPELKLLSQLAVVQGARSSVKEVLVKNGLLRKVHRVTASGPAQEVLITVPDLYQYFEPYYTGEDILHLEEMLQSVSRELNLFRVLYSFEPKVERIYLRKLKEYNFSQKEVTDIVDVLKKRDIIEYAYNNPVLFKIKDKEAYRKFLREDFLSGILNGFSNKLQQPIHSNTQAYTVLAEFEKEFRSFLEEILKRADAQWEERIPKDVLGRLKERQNDARIRRKTVYPLLHYIDFPNYLSIILHRTNKFNNWELFEPYFVSIGWIKARLIEMNEIRNDLAHPKPLEPLQYRKLQLYIDEMRERIT